MQVEFSEDGNGFWAKFDNGWTMSVQWRTGDYATISTVEIAAWDTDQPEDSTVWWDFEEGKPVPPKTSVLGWVTSDELGGYMNDIASITWSSTELQFIALALDSIRLPHNPLRATVGDILSPKRTDEE